MSKTQERALLAGLILIGWAFIVLARLFIVQVVQHDALAKQARHQQERQEAIEAQRGSIFDRGGNLLAISSNWHTAIVNPKRIPSKEFAADLLAGILHRDSKQLQEYLESPKHGGYLVVDNHLTDAQAASLESMHLDWLEIRQASVRSYPNGAVASHVIGNVDFQGKGVSGIEAKFNKDLAGTPGLRLVEKDGKAVSYESEIEKTPVAGKSIGLTIDRELQFVAQSALKAAIQENHADHGSLVAMNPRTGEILALENYPTFDPNERLLNGGKPVGRENLAVTAPYEPGSVFKIVTLSAALETTSLRPESLIDCGNGVMKMYTRVIHDTHPHSVLSMQDVLAFSSNIGAIKIGMQVGNEKLYDYIRRFGFGHRTGIELPAENPGILRPLKRWQPTSIGSVPMGHEIGVTAVQLAAMGSVIANGGFLVQPHLMAWQQVANEKREYVKHPAPVQVLQPETVMKMRMMMRRVITEPHGTGHRLHVIGYSLAGKTGTAQIYDFQHKMYTHRYNASFLGFAPANNPAVVVVVSVSGTTGEAGFGGSAAGPAFVKVLSTALNRLGIVRDVPGEIDELIAKKNPKGKEKAAAPDAEADTDEVAELATPFTEEEARAFQPETVAASAEPPPPPVPGLLWQAKRNTATAPNFVGKTVRDVIEEATSRGIEVDMLGDGLARAQYPPAGSVLNAGERIRVKFER